MQKLSEELDGAEAVFAIEEPEVHLHPQAARTLWTRIAQLPGQKLVTTHSPYFVQNVPLHNLRIVRFNQGSSKVAFLKRKVVSDLPWTTEVENLVKGKHLTQFEKDGTSGFITSNLWFEEDIAKALIKCLRTVPGANLIQKRVDSFRHSCRMLVSKAEESELTFLGRRVRGEIFFAREWLLVEGPSEFLLLHAIGRALGYELDQHGISVIDFQNNGNAGIYAVLADAFDIPWRMATDGDPESAKFQAQLVKRGYSPVDIKDHVSTLPPPNDLEDQLLADGHESLLREVLAEAGVSAAAKCPIEDLRKLLKNRKTEYMAKLAPRVAANTELASKMPSFFVGIINSLKKTQNAARV